MSAQRKLERRARRSETSLDLHVELAEGKRIRSRGKTVRSLQKGLTKAIRAARLVSGLLIRATGAHTAELVAQPSKVDAYHQRLAQAGTSISTPTKAVVHVGV